MGRDCKQNGNLKVLMRNPCFGDISLDVETKTFITARKRSLGQGNIFRSVCQEFCPQGEACMVAGGHAWLLGGHAWLLGGLHGCGGVCMVAGRVRGCRGACMVAGGHAWLLEGAWLLGGMHGCRGVRRIQ